MGIDFQVWRYGLTRCGMAGLAAQMGVQNVVEKIYREVVLI
jgi:hypothetical protein